MEETWRKNVVHTYWTEVAERFFMERMVELNNPNPQPLTASQWRDRICNLTGSGMTKGVQSAAKMADSFVWIHNHNTR